ncbi:glycosyltransferase [Enterococcus sp. 22-H-5-01]|uniref:glycosyltransferase n=1 Tax=Enterococcus sp. 22-H-5-01 TaxID=3418555 RepID=UPI003D061909
MNGIFISQDLSHAEGINEKIYKQIAEFRKQGINMTTHINPRRNNWHLFVNVVPFFSIQYFNTKNIEWKKYDFAYIRKGAIFDRSFIKMVKRAKKENPAIKLIVEIPTYPYIDEFQGILKWIISSKEKIWVPKLAKYIDKNVTYSDDTTIYEIPSINISNAYEFLEKPNHKDKADSTVNLVAVASLCFYHGYDRVINGLINYYRKNNKQTKVRFTLVGDGPVLNEYKKIVKDTQMAEYVQLVGRKNLDELDEFYAQADIGIDSLARHRSGVSYNSSLKGKEYLAKGLPIVSGVKTDLDNADVDFYYRVPADDSPLDIERIVQWYESLLAKQSQDELSNLIYTYGKEHFTFSKTFEPVIDYVKGACNG